MPISKTRYHIVLFSYNAEGQAVLNRPIYTDANGTEDLLFEPNGYSLVESAREALNEKDVPGDYAIVPVYTVGYERTRRFDIR